MPKPKMTPEAQRAYHEALRRIEKCGPTGAILDLSGLGLTTLPPEIGQLSALTRLVLHSNRLRALPSEIGQLAALTELDVSNNALATLPPEIGHLSALTDLHLYHNAITALPPGIGNLSTLRKLHLFNNRLVTLPSELRHLSMLKELLLRGNSDLKIPEEVLGPTFPEMFLSKAIPKPPKEILDYYFATQQGEGVPLQEMKLLVVGWGGAGKTSLVKRLAGQAMDGNERETHGVMVRPLTLFCTDGEVTARVWDFGGQMVLHSMHEFFLTARSLYLLVLEQRSDRAETDAKYWLQIIRSYAPEAPVVVALNKSSGIERPLDRQSLEKAFGPIVAWVPTECLPEKDCAGADATIEALQRALTAAAEEPRMPESRKLFPGKWVAIKAWLESLDQEGTNFLDYETFAHGCAARGEPDPTKQREVAALMHDLGIAMNYARDERLRDTTVLRPDWLANGIYAVLRANLFLSGHPLAPDAILTPEKLGEIYKAASLKPVEMLNEEDYPAERWEFLLRLMNLFQLSFPLTEDGLRQLCPTLLRAEPPPGTDEPRSEDVVRLRYEFNVVPAPLLPRFMVRAFMGQTASLIDPNKLWQRGAVLRYAQAQALVWTTPEEKYVFATIDGPEGDRRDLMQMIRGTFTELFREYKALHVTEQWWFDGHWVPRQTLQRFGVLELDDTTPGGEEGKE